MKRTHALERYSFWTLAAFAATAAVAMFWQHLVWAAVALWLLAWARGETRPAWPRGPLGAATLLFLATFLTGALFGVDPSNSFGALHKYLTFLLYFLIGAMALDPGRIEKLLRFFAAGTAVCAVQGILSHFFFGENRINSFSGHIMVFGGMLMTAALVQVVFLVRSPRNPWNWALLALILEALLLNRTRGAWIGLVAGLLFLLWMNRRRWLLPALALMAAGYFLLPQAYQERVRSIWDSSLRHTNQERLWMWGSGWRIARDHPWFGVGQDNVGAVYADYYREGARERHPAHLHNNFVQVLAQNGWVGLAAYLFWIGAFYFQAFRRRAGPREAWDWNGVLTCVFTAILVWGLTEYTFSHQIMNLQFFLLGLQANLWKGTTKGQT